MLFLIEGEKRIPRMIICSEMLRQRFLLPLTGLWTQNMAASLGMGALYNGYLARIADANDTLKQWLEIEGKTIKACMLLGYPDRTYMRTAPRKKANVIWK